ncbi:MAG: DUF6089 family protein, partial [Bacteroidota bacterium]
VFFGVGASNFVGELGGAGESGRNFVGDLDLNMTRPTFAVGYRYRLSGVTAWKSTLIYGRLNGDDANSDELFRKNRNLHFRSPVIELSTQMELYFLREQAAGRYRLRGVKSAGKFNLAGYVFTGIGLFWFNPKAKINDEWVGLRNLGTEGQGLPGGPDKYSPISIAIPAGIGFKYGIDRRGRWSLGLEFGVRKTFSDYIDDVSGNYFDNDLIRQENGEIAALAADPSLGIVTDGDDKPITRAGQQRGDSGDKDTYMFAILNLNYRFLRKKDNRPKF